jgi:hypothetical protein
MSTMLELSGKNRADVIVIDHLQQCKHPPVCDDLDLT